MATKVLSTKTYIAGLRTAFELLGDKQIAAEQARYMKHLFPFFGLKTPERSAVVKGYIKEHGLPPFEKLEDVLKACYKQPEREFHYTAITLASLYMMKHAQEMIALMEFLITHNTWWDTVDGTSSACVRPLFKQHPELIDKLTLKWVKSDNMWLQRSAIIAQLGYRKDTNEKVLFRNIKALNGGKEFFINKAIGWALREYSKTHRQQVIDFIAENKLHPLSVREASKYL